MHAAGISSREDAKTRRMGLMNDHSGVYAHPLRTRVGTKPAPTRPLADRELPTSLREDLGREVIAKRMLPRAEE